MGKGIGSYSTMMSLLATAYLLLLPICRVQHGALQTCWNFFAAQKTKPD